MLRCFKSIILAMVIAVGGGSQAHAQVTNAPLHLFINGSGTVSPLTNGESLQVAQTYNMVATPNPGVTFGTWQPANVLTYTTYTIDASGNTNVNVLVVPSLIPNYTNQPSLNFVMQPEVVIENNPGVMTITKGAGWQANFYPVLLNIQWSDSAVVLSWTNSGFVLQAAPAPLGVYTNVSGAVSAYTNNISGPAQYFRLVGQ